MLVEEKKLTPLWILTMAYKTRIIGNRSRKISDIRLWVRKFWKI
jgi:hypothetical protein